MNRRMWLLVIGVLILMISGIYYVTSQIFQTIPKPVIYSEPPPPIWAHLDFTTMQNLSFGRDVSGDIKLVLHQGDIGSLKINFTQHYTTEKLSVRLYLYGIAPNFDIYQLYRSVVDLQNMNFPEGITSSIDPSTLEMTENTAYSVNLTIVASSNAEVGVSKLHLIVLEFSTKDGHVAILFDDPLMLEIVAKT